VLDVGEFLRAAVLAPPLRGTTAVEDQRRVRAAAPDPGLLRRAVVASLLTALQMEGDAPASTEDAVVPLDKLSERIPRGGIKGPDRIGRHLVI
jgi:hypothetical protein